MPQPLFIAEPPLSAAKGSQFGGTRQHLTLYIFISLRDIIEYVRWPWLDYRWYRARDRK
jgi:hypothetical protein